MAKDPLNGPAIAARIKADVLRAQSGWSEWNAEHTAGDVDTKVVETAVEVLDAYARGYLEAIDRGGNPNREADRHQNQHLPHHQPDHRAGPRSQRHSQSQFPGPTPHREGHHSVEPDGRQQPEAGREKGDQPYAAREPSAART